MGNPMQAYIRPVGVDVPKMQFSTVREEMQFRAESLKQAHKDLKNSGLNSTTKNILERIPNVECLENTGKQTIEQTPKVQKLLQKILKFVTKIK